MTLKEIAKEAGVSISTVSRVVNQCNTKIASKEVQERVWEIVRRTGYIPNSSARNLKLGQDPTKQSLSAKIIACIFARSDIYSDPFFSQISRSLEQEAYKKDYIVKYSFSAFDINKLSTQQLLEPRIEGVIILGRASKQLLRIVEKHCKNIVYTGLNTIHEKYDQITCDAYLVAKAAVEYLADLGHTKIGYIGEQKEEQRFLGYKESLLNLHLPYAQNHIANVSLSAEGGYKGALSILNQNPELTALLCANDSTAIGAIRALKEQGKEIPEDISIIGIDDIETAQYLSPMLTTIHIPVEEMGKVAAKILIDRIENGHRLPLKIQLPFYIAKRESCTKPRKER